MVEIKFNPAIYSDPSMYTLFVEVNCTFEPELSHIDGPVFKYEEDNKYTKELTLGLESGVSKVYTYEEEVYNLKEGSVTYTNLKEKEVNI